MADKLKRPIWILPVIIASQFAGTSLWFATNAILPDLQRELGYSSDILGIMTSSVQLGFILGTLAFAFFMISDRYSPRVIFFLCSLLGATCNALLVFLARDTGAFLVLRVLTGICLAGIYPVGMKIASSWYDRGLGNALGFLVGALVLGTAFPHLLRGVGAQVQWETVMIAVSVLAAGGGILMLMFVPDGPHHVKGTAFTPNALRTIFRSAHLRSAAFGYLGHMWELYTLYVFVPLMLSTYISTHGINDLNISFWSFCIIAAGGLGCIGGGVLSKRFGSAKIAFAQLLMSSTLCLCSPLLYVMPKELFLFAMVLWGTVVVGDSPQFSALIARHAPPQMVGSALTIGNCIGFAITIISIQLISFFSHIISPQFLFLLLAPGPIIGLIFAFPLAKIPRDVETLFPK